MSNIYRCPICKRFLLNFEDNDYKCINTTCDFKDVIFTIEEKIDKETKERQGHKITFSPDKQVKNE